MRALNPAASKTIATFDPTTQPPRKQSPAGLKSLGEAKTHGPLHALNTSTTSGPRRLSSRQSAPSSSFSNTAGHNKTSNRRLPPNQLLAAKPSKPTIITTSVAKNTRVVSNTDTSYNHNRSTKPPPQVANPGSRSSSLPSSFPATRSPLQHRNQNATQIAGNAPSSSSMSRNVKVTMPYDRSPNPSGGRPQMPTLSVGSARGLGKPPITPKIAAKPSQSPAVAASTHTPLAKRIPRPTHGTLATPVPPRSTPQPEEEPSLFLSNNITPRSGKRQSRVDSANSTPNGTPNPERHDGWDRDARAVRAASPRGHDGDVARRPALGLASISSDLHIPKRQESQPDFDSKFFHASDARPTHQAPPKPTLAKAPTFFYADGNKVENKSSTHVSYTSAPSHNSSQDNLPSKFVYANGTPDLKPTPPVGPSRPGSVVSMASKAPTSRPGTASHSGGHTAAQRPESPIKLAQPPHISQPRNTNVPPSSTGRAQISLPPQLGPALGLRRTSTGTSRGSHSRNSSLVMGDADIRSAFIPSGPSSPLPLASPSQPPLTLASIIQAAEEFGEDESVASPDDFHSEIQSPTKSAHSLDPLTDLIANARRERKVQDLQITNASLEAINRTLERQLRKQTAELRRYRRMSRAGRLSAVPSVASSRMVSDPISIREDVEGLTLSDLDEENSEDELDEKDELDEEDSFSDTDSTSDSIGQSLLAERDARYRKRDEKRLQLDLSKHQELLIDSQKINQSMKRCLDWTEELIKEGKKALEYKVHVSDVEIPGPRVLNPVDEEEDHTQTSINFDPDITFEDTSIMTEGVGEDEDEDVQNRLEQITPLEPKLAGWKPETWTGDNAVEFPLHGG
ncbi:hypothetical protein SCAR479_03441 [Seiridium cardinale]|uniref:Uncharacterized protein n=1 Tax=Seiridium cardinale TaxID=138064 RepID=A0ABR2Y1D3_9PEZI